MTLSRASLMSPSGCPVTGSRVLRGSIGPAVTLHLPLPLAGMLWVCVCGTVLLLRVCVLGLRCCARSVCPAAARGAGGVGVILLWIGCLCGLILPSWTNALEAPHW